jgi:WD40 repeat protein
MYRDHHGHKTLVDLLEVLPDGRLVSADVDDHLFLWDPTTGQTTQLPDPAIESRGWFTSYARQLLVLSEDRLIYVDSGGGATHFQLTGRSKPANVVSSRIEGLDPPLSWLGATDGNLFARDGKGIVWEVKVEPTGIVSQRRELFRHAQRSGKKPGAFAWLPDGGIQSFGEDGLVVWDPRVGQERFRKDFHPWKVTHATVLPGGLLIAGTVEGEILAWDPSSDDPPIEVYSHGERIVALTPTAQGWVISSSKEKSASDRRDVHVLAWRPGLDQPVVLNPEGREHTCVLALPDGHVVLVEQSKIRFFDKELSSLLSERASLLVWSEFLVPLPDEMRLILASPMGVTVFSPSTCDQAWLVRWDQHAMRPLAAVWTAAPGASSLVAMMVS